MNSISLFTSLSSPKIATRINKSVHRVIFAAPGIHPQPAQALVELSSRLPTTSITVSLDLDEHTLRMGYGTLKSVDTLCDAGIVPTHSRGLRTGILIVDDRGWIFTPTALYLEAEPQSDETPNAVEIPQEQVASLSIRLSRSAQREAEENAGTPEEAQRIHQITPELGIQPVASSHLKNVRSAIEFAPPVKFDVVRQVRVFEPFLQYVEISLTGAAVQRHRVRIPKELQNLGTSEDLEGKLKTTFDLIEKGSSMSSKSLEDELNEVRKNFTPSLGKDHGRVVLKNAKPHLNKRITELKSKLELHQKKVEAELQGKLDTSKKQIIDHYLPLAIADPPDALLGSLFKSVVDEESVRIWLDEVVTRVFPTGEDLIRQMNLEVRYKDVTFETLNHSDFLSSVQKAFPRVNWEKAYNEFKAAGEKVTSRQE